MMALYDWFEPRLITYITSSSSFFSLSVGGDDFLVVHTRDDFAALHGTTPYTHSNPGTPISVPWLGGMQTGRGAAVVSSQPGFIE